MLLYMYVIAFSPISGRCLRVVPVMRSYPSAFVGRSLVILSLTSATVNFWMLIAGSVSELVRRGSSC